MSNQKPSKLRTLDSQSISKDDLFIAVDVDELSSPTGETKTINFDNLSKGIFAYGGDATDIPYVSGSSSASIYDIVEGKLNISDGDLLQDRFDNLNTDDVENVSRIPTVSGQLTEALDVLYVQSRSVAVGISSTQCFSATANQTVFPLSPNVIPQNSLVYNDGILISNSDYSLISDTLTLSSSAAVNDDICVIDFGQTASFGKSFLALGDTPGKYEDSDTYVVTVDEFNGGLVFTPNADSFTKLKDTPNEVTESMNHLVIVNDNGTGLEFISTSSLLSNMLLDEDDMISNSTSSAPTQQSVTAFVSSSIAVRIKNDSSFATASVTDGASQQSIVNYVTGRFSDIVIDQDDMSSNDNTKIPTQQSVKAYVDNIIDGVGSKFALIQETQPSGKYCDGSTASLNGTAWYNRYRDLTGTVQYVQNVIGTNHRFFKRNLNSLKVNVGSIVEDFNTTYSKFTLKPGYYRISGWVYGMDTRSNIVRLKVHTADINNGTAFLSMPRQEFVDNSGSSTYFSFFVEASGGTLARTYSLEHGVTEFNHNNDLGQPYTPIGGEEIYSQLEIQKL